MEYANCCKNCVLNNDCSHQRDDCVEDCQTYQDSMNVEDCTMSPECPCDDCQAESSLPMDR